MLEIWPPYDSDRLGLPDKLFRNCPDLLGKSALLLSLSKNLDLGRYIGDVQKSFWGQSCNARCQLQELPGRRLPPPRLGQPDHPSVLRAAICSSAGLLEAGSQPWSTRTSMPSGTNSNYTGFEMMGRFSFMILEARIVLPSTKLRQSLSSSYFRAELNISNSSRTSHMFVWKCWYRATMCSLLMYAPHCSFFFSNTQILY